MAERDAGTTTGESGTVILRGTDGDPIHMEDAPPPGTRLGRYALQRPLGRGGMGIVMEAYDPELARTVAIKLVRPGTGGPRAAQRLLREARALARLQHPAIISVFEVGKERGQSFICMECVAGRTLRRWLAEARPGWVEIVDVMLRAGRGLAAAHEAGVVHRDFKPANVLLDEHARDRDGKARVLVVDFGIATVDALGAASAGLDSVDAALADLTGGDVVMGTPAYMAPEQMTQGRIDASSDQFAFCVTLWEAVYGHRPFIGTSLEELARQKLDGEIASPPSSAVPAWLRAVMLRGLAARPDDRWPSMTALLDRLERRPRRWPVALAVAAVGAASGLAWYGLASSDASARPCEAGAEIVAEVWNPTRRTALETAFEQTEVSYARDSAARVVAWLDAYGRDWARAHDEACAAVDASGLDLRMACLRRRLADADALLEVLADADAGVVRQATQAAASLAPVAECGDVELLAARIAPPRDPELRDAVARVRRRIALASAQYSAGAFEHGVQTATEAKAEADGLDYVPVQVEAGHRLGRLYATVGRYEDAERELLEAVHAANAIGYDEGAAGVAADLAFLVGYRLARPEDGEKWVRFAESAADRGSVGARVRADVASNTGAVKFARSDYEGAIADMQSAIEIRESLFGRDHPEVAVALNNLGSAYLELGRLDDAEVALRRSGAIWAANVAADHPVLATSATTFSALLERKHRYAEAEALMRNALRIRELELGPDHPDVATALDNLGSLLYFQGQLDESRALIERGLAIRRSTLPDPHPHRVSSLNNLGTVLQMQGHAAEAEAVLREAMTGWRATLGEDHVHASYTLTALGLTLADLGRTEEAEAVLRRAVDIRASKQASPYLAADSRFALARVVEGRAEACTLAREASDAYAQEGLAAKVTEVAAWSSDHCAQPM